MGAGALRSVGGIMSAVGQRDRYVTIQQCSATDAATDTGLPTETWTTLKRVWMSRKDRGFEERLRDQQVAAAFDTTWEMPYMASMDPELVDVPKVRRLLVNGRMHDITGARVMPFEEGQCIELTTLAGTRI